MDCELSNPFPGEIIRAQRCLVLPWWILAQANDVNPDTGHPDTAAATMSDHHRCPQVGCKVHISAHHMPLTHFCHPVPKALFERHTGSECEGLQRSSCHLRLCCWGYWGTKPFSYFFKVLSYIDHNPPRSPWQVLGTGTHSCLDSVPRMIIYLLGRKPQDLLARSSGVVFPVGRQRPWEVFHRAQSWSQELGMILSGPACFWLVWQALASYQMWKFFSAWDNLFICLCILPGKYLLSSWYSFARDS